MKQVNKLTRLLEEAGPYLAAGVSDDVSTQEISHIQQKGLDIAELRIDHYSQKSPVYVLNEIKKFEALATIATIRTEKEGGKWDGDEESRLKLFKDIIPRIDAVDIESSAVEIIDEVISEAKNNDVRVIVSHHNFERTPSIKEMLEVAEDAHKKGAEIIKIATYINGDEDIKNLTSLLADSDKKLVVIGMGSKGAITRLTLPAYGSLITFCRLGQQTTAPGQLGLDEMANHLRVYYPEYNRRLIEENQLMECV